MVTKSSKHTKRYKERPISCPVFYVLILYNKLYKYWRTKIAAKHKNKTKHQQHRIRSRLAIDINLKTNQRSYLWCHFNALHARVCQYRASFKDTNSLQILKFTGKKTKTKTGIKWQLMDRRTVSLLRACSSHGFLDTTNWKNICVFIFFILLPTSAVRDQELMIWLV